MPDILWHLSAVKSVPGRLPNLLSIWKWFERIYYLLKPDNFRASSKVILLSVNIHHAKEEKLCKDRKFC